MYIKGKSIETESRLVASGWGSGHEEGDAGVKAKGYRVSL